MVDLEMCLNDKCERAYTCKRNEKSGTRPSDYCQAYGKQCSLEDGSDCNNYWKKEQDMKIIKLSNATYSWFV